MTILPEQIEMAKTIIELGVSEEEAARRVLGYDNGPLSVAQIMLVGDLRVAVVESMLHAPGPKPPKQTQVEDMVNHPSHYTAYKGIEIIQLTEQLNFCRGNAVKYIARAGLKSEATEIQDLEKASWYINREIERLKKARVEDRGRC
jgi:hypothetical protein